MHLDRRSFVIWAGKPAATRLGRCPHWRPDRLQAERAGRVDHSAYDALLKAFVKPDASGYNRVDYRGVKSSSGCARPI
jgi:hypothetical protein